MKTILLHFFNLSLYSILGAISIIWFVTNAENQLNNIKTTEMNKQEIATFGGGCFWCTEAVFDELKGVEKVTSGYSGGKLKNPTYREICTGETGHAEVIHITFNPSEVRFVQLLDIFFATHNSTTLNQQGADIGTQYRSVVFYHNEQQKQDTIDFIAALEKDNIFEDKIVTEISPFKIFYKAADEHQDYYKNNQESRYCNAVLNPKLMKFRKRFKEMLKDY